MTRLGWFGGLLCLCGWAIFLYVYGYETFTLKLALWSGKTDRLDVLRNQYLTSSLFLGLRIVSTALVFVYLLTYRWLHQLERWLAQVWRLTLQLLSMPFQSLQSLTASQKIVLLAVLALITLSRIYYYWLLPLQYDEAFTYIHLVHKGLLVSATYYPGPNNHVLFTEVASLLNKVLPSLLALRLPSLLGSLLFWLLLWDWFVRKIRFEWALLLATLLVLTPTLSVYAIMGRGYSLQLLCALVGFRTILATQYVSIHRFAFVVSSVVGFYLVPTYLYVFVFLVIFKTSQLFHSKNRAYLKPWLLDLVIITLITSILYLPIILLNGLGAIIQNGWVQPLSLDQWFSRFPQYLASLAQALWGDEAGLSVGIGFLFLLLVTFVLKPRKYFGMLGIALLLLLLLVQQVLPPARTLQYLVLLPGWWMVEWLPTQTSHSTRTFAITFALSASLLFYGITTTQTLRHVAQTSQPHIEIARKITSEQRPQKIGVTHDTYAVFLQYFNAQNGGKHQIDIQPNEGMRYDWRIHSLKHTGKAAKLPSNAQLYLKNQEVIIYK